MVLKTEFFSSRLFNYAAEIFPITLNEEQLLITTITSLFRQQSQTIQKLIRYLKRDKDAKTLTSCISFSTFSSRRLGTLTVVLVPSNVYWPTWPLRTESTTCLSFWRSLSVSIIIAHIERTFETAQGKRQRRGREKRTPLESKIICADRSLVLDGDNWKYKGKASYLFNFFCYIVLALINIFFCSVQKSERGGKSPFYCHRYDLCNTICN